jgi:hypothetical protein
VTTPARPATPGQQHAQGDHPHAEQEVQPVVGRVDRHEVGRAGLVDDQPVDPQHQVDDAAAHQVRAGARVGAGQRQPGDAEQQVDHVVQDRHLEDPEQHGHRVVAGDAHVAVAGGDAGDEPQHTDQQEDGTDDAGRQAQQVPAASRCTTGGGVVRHEGLPGVVQLWNEVVSTRPRMRAVLLVTGFVADGATGS